MSMEQKLRENLLSLFAEFHKRSGGAMSTLSAKVSGDARFYAKLASGLSLFTVRRYDTVVAKFAVIWPTELEWPDTIERIRLEEVQLRPRKQRANLAARA